MSEKLGSLYITRHGKAEQEKIDASSLNMLSHEEFQKKIRELNMRQGLDGQGKRQADLLGKFLSMALANEPPPLVVAGPYLRHQQSAANASRHFSKAPSITKEGLAERSRGRVDASIMWAKLMETAMPNEYRAKTERPASWVPGKTEYPDDPAAWGEDYAGVNRRLLEVIATFIRAVSWARPPSSLHREKYHSPLYIKVALVIGPMQSFARA